MGEYQIEMEADLKQMMDRKEALAIDLIAGTYSEEDRHHAEEQALTLKEWAEGKEV